VGVAVRLTVLDFGGALRFIESADVRLSRGRKIPTHAAVRFDGESQDNKVFDRLKRSNPRGRGSNLCQMSRTRLDNKFFGRVGVPKTHEGDPRTLCLAALMEEFSVGE
jgi:hypothetical protein